MLQAVFLFHKKGMRNMETCCTEQAQTAPIAVVNTTLYQSKKNEDGTVSIWIEGKSEDDAFVVSEADYEANYAPAIGTKVTASAATSTGAVPTVGRIVYYKSAGSADGSYPSVERAAIVTQVHTPTCIDLCVINPTGLHFNTSVMQGDGPMQWDWMPYQKEQQAKA